jgi:protein arginine N-methyltransferase 1
MFGANPEAIFHFHAGLLMDGARTDTYHRAIASIVKPGDVVLDLGSGTGILSLLACQAGARRVYAVESGDVAELSRLVSTANGFEDRVVLLHDTSYRVTLPEKVDVIVTDTLHTFGLQDGLLGSMIDARQRFLKPGGRISPRSIQLVVVPVELPDIYRRLEIWSADPLGFDFSPLREFATNNLYSVPVERDALRKAFLGEPASVIQIRLPDAETANLSGEAHAIAARPGVMHGLGGWFVAELDEGVFLSNSPDIMTVSWKNAFFPLDRPVTLAQGDALTLKIETCNGATWRWQVAVNGRTLAERASFRGFPLSKEAFHKLSPAYAPMLTPEGDAERFVLGLFNGERTVGEMEGKLRRRYPESFTTSEAAAAFVRDLARRCS